MSAKSNNNIIKNETRFTVHPWEPKQKLFNVPVKKDFVEANRSKTDDQNLYRLWSMFPYLGFALVQDLFKENSYNFVKTVDSCLYFQLTRSCEDSTTNNLYAQPFFNYTNNAHYRQYFSNFEISEDERKIFYDFEFIFKPIKRTCFYTNEDSDDNGKTDDTNQDKKKTIPKAIKVSNNLNSPAASAIANIQPNPIRMKFVRSNYGNYTTQML